MATQRSLTGSDGAGLARPSTTWITRYQLHVLATDAADVVRSAGGWLCDRARAGWDVDVLLVDAADTRPLTILGATVTRFDGDVAAAVRKVGEGALAVSAALLTADVLALGLPEVTVWGSGEVGRPTKVLEHQLSSAAQAFKAHALAAASSTDAVAGTERLYRLDAEPARPLRSV